MKLQKLYNDLYIYDVVQHAWEQEPNGPDANIRHVLTHLTKDITGKDFTSDQECKTKIAPDSVQYALRLLRWTGQNVLALEDYQVDTDELAEIAKRLGYISLAQTAFIELAATVARATHDLDHKSELLEATKRRPEECLKAAALLLYCAVTMSEGGGFDIADVFAERLDELRFRFGISTDFTKES